MTSGKVPEKQFIVIPRTEEVKRWARMRGVSMGNRWASSRCMTQLAPLGTLAALQGALPLPVLQLPLFLTTCSPPVLPFFC